MKPCRHGGKTMEPALFWTLPFQEGNRDCYRPTQWGGDAKPAHTHRRVNRSASRVHRRSDCLWPVSNCEGGGPSGASGERLYRIESRPAGGAIEITMSDTGNFPIVG